MMRTWAGGSGNTGDKFEVVIRSRDDKRLRNYIIAKYLNENYKSIVKLSANHDSITVVFEEHL